jgi:phosphomevalonate kinase
MTATLVSAPGKIVLCGEYAVLDGAPAICMAIDRRARAKVRAVDNDYHTVRTIGYIDGEWKFRTDRNGSFEWIGSEPPAGGLNLLQQIWKTTGIIGEFDIELDTGEFVDSVSHSKLGLGSSAALAAALVTALFDVTSNPGDAGMLAVKAHRLFQQGRGSGVDIAASLNGGVIEYRMQESGVGRSLPWPAGLEYAVLWSGRPVSTSEKLRKLDEGCRDGSSGASVARLIDASEATAKTWVAGSTAELLAEFHRYVEVLKQFDVDHDLGIFDAGHRQLADAAAERNVVYKPCGAGGGDTGIVFATDRQAIATFTDLAGEGGFQVLDVSLEERGVLFEN